MARFRIPHSQFLKFVREEDYSLSQMDDRRLTMDFEFLNVKNRQYCAKLQRDDEAFIQFRTDYSDFQIYLVDDSGNDLNVNSWLEFVSTLDDGRKVWNINIHCGSLNDYYYLRIYLYQPYKPIATFRSEWFHVTETHNDSLLLQWNTSDNDGMIWGDKSQSIRVKGRLFDFETGNTKHNYTDSDGAVITLTGKGSRHKVLQIEPVPQWIVERLNLALIHEHFYINSVEFTCEDKIEANRIGETNLYDVSIKLREKYYEDYTSDEEMTGEYPEIVHYNLKISDADELLISSDKLLIS